MYTSKFYDLNSICRICLNYATNLKSLFQTEAAKMLSFCQFMEVQEMDHLPKYICYDCDKSLLECFNFKQKCINSCEILKNFEESILSESLLTFSSSTSNQLESTETVSNDNIQNEKISPVCIQNDLNYSNCEVLPNCHTTSQEIPFELINGGDQNVLDLIVGGYNIQQEQIKSPLPLIVEEELTSFLDDKCAPPLPYKCTSCTQSFLSESDLELHKITHISSDLTCVICGKELYNRQLFKRHIKIHMTNKPHVCQKCGKGYAESHSLTKHMLLHLGIQREKKHVCSECGQGFAEPYYLKVHSRKHTGERPFTCKNCGKEFSDPRSFKVHNRMHSGEKPYKCHICLRSFSQNVNLKKHIRVHTGERPYSCTFCDKRFSQSSSLDKHRRTHTGEKPYACDRCSKSFGEKSTLIQHTRIHTAEKPYICEQCGISFSSSSGLKLHDRKHSRKNTLYELFVE